MGYHLSLKSVTNEGAASSTKSLSGSIGPIGGVGDGENSCLAI